MCPCIRTFVYMYTYVWFLYSRTQLMRNVYTHVTRALFVVHHVLFLCPVHLHTVMKHQNGSLHAFLALMYATSRSGRQPRSIFTRLLGHFDFARNSNQQNLGSYWWFIGILTTAHMAHENPLLTINLYSPVRSPVPLQSSSLALT